MKAVLKILTALAAIAGVVFVIATYGDKIVAWAKKLIGKCPCQDEDICVDEAVEEPDEEVAEAVEEAEAAEAEAPVEEVVIDANEPVADEADFEA